MYYIVVVVLFNRYKSLFSIQATSKTEMAKSILDGLLPPDLRDKYRIGKYKVGFQHAEQAPIRMIFTKC